MSSCTWNRTARLAGLIGALLATGGTISPIWAQALKPRQSGAGPFEVERFEPARSAFRLFGEGDRAFIGLRPTGNIQWFVTNTGIVDAADLPIFSQVFMFGCPLCNDPNLGAGQFFDVSPIMAADQSDWLRFLEQAPSLANALGGGWSVSRNGPTDGLTRELNASDGSFGSLFSGVETTSDGGCRDYSAFDPANPAAAAGLTLLAGSGCPPTWPTVDGEPTFLGDNPITLENYANSQTLQGPEFEFQWWRVPAEEVDRSAFFGNFQTYGSYDDFNSAVIGRFGNVVPGGAGEPIDEGWPLGIRTEFNAFTFALPTVSNTMYWRALIINETERVYGVGLDYESLYLGYTYQPLRAQESTFYAEPWRGALLTAESQTGSDFCPGVTPPGTAAGRYDCNNTGSPDVGFDLGATGLVVLKSPIGDLRNVLFSCSSSEGAQRAATRSTPCTTDAFFDPGNPHVGDTITYNHLRMCDFGQPCSGEVWLTESDRRIFGAVASDAEDALDGRSPNDLVGGPDAIYGIFRNPNFPDQPTPFPAWVPGTWDYTANGATPGGDTLWVQTCYGLPGSGRSARSDACVVTWSDTMPVGELGNPTYNNQEGNSAFWSLGPFALGAGDTTALVLAMVAGLDSASFEAEVNNAIELYMNFFLSPQAPPKVTIVGTDVRVVNPAATATSTKGEVTLFWDDASNDFVDPFLENFANTMEEATAGDLARIRELNPGLLDRIRGRARDNLARILIFKSCDRGATFTTADTDARGDLDCDADPATNLEGSPVAGIGWQAYAAFETDPQGNAPNMFKDNLVKAGQEYLYVVLGESRGARFSIADSVDIDGDGIFDIIGSDSLNLAPQLLNPLSRSTAEPNVVTVYVPASVQAGGQPAAAEIVGSDPGNSTVPFDVLVTGTAVTAGRYNAIFGNQFRITRSDELVDDSVASRWTVTARDVVLATDPAASPPAPAVIDSAVFSTLNPNGLTVSGFDLTGDETVVDGLGFVLVREGTGEPLLVSTVLDGENTTAPRFFGRRAASNVAGDFTGFPGFIVQADNTEAGDFNRQRYLGPNGTVIPGAVAPTVAWDVQGSDPVQAGGITGFGDYAIDWAGRTFGPGSPFRLNQEDPAATDEEFDQSIEARAVGQTGLVDEETAALLSAATGEPVSADDLVPVRVPFEVRNLTFERDVEVAMIRRENNELLLGTVRGLRSGATERDTLSVSVAEDAWVPGDRLFFIETVQRDSMIGGAVVLDEDGVPIQVERPAVTFAPAIMSCGAAPRPGCNPVTGPGGSNDWVSNGEGQTLSVEYFSPFQLESRFVFDVKEAILDEEVLTAERDISGQIDSVKVVPNPYVMFSEYQVASPGQDDARLLFTHLPPSGTIRIFNVAGRFVQELTWQPSDLAGNGDLFWDMRTRESNQIAAGLYVFVLEAENPANGDVLRKSGKFVIIR